MQFLALVQSKNFLFVSSFPARALANLASVAALPAAPESFAEANPAAYDMTAMLTFSFSCLGRSMCFRISVNNSA